MLDEAFRALVCGAQAECELVVESLDGNGSRLAVTICFDPAGALTTSPFSNITINRGWTVGGGIEARLCGNLTGRIEYLYLDLGTTHALANNQTVMTLTTQLSSRVTDQLVRAGINYKFD